MTSLAKTAAVIAGALVLLLAGVWWGGHPESLPGPLRDAFVDDDRALRAELVDSIQDSFYKPVKPSEIDEGSLKGIVDGLGDQFSQYLTPKETREFRQTVAGELEGVGPERGGGPPRAAGAPRVRRLPGRPRRHQAGRAGGRGERQVDRRRAEPGGHGAHQGPGGHAREARGGRPRDRPHAHARPQAREDRGARQPRAGRSRAAGATSA